MTLLSRKADYALLILSHLYQNRVGGNAREIAERFGLSRPFAANILKELCQRGYVASHRGVKGGYALLPAATTATLAELLAAIDEEFRLTQCSTPTPHEHCSLEAGCPVRHPLTEIHRRIVGVLRGVTLVELFDPPGALRTPSGGTTLTVLSDAAPPFCTAHPTTA